MKIKHKDFPSLVRHALEKAIRKTKLSFYLIAIKFLAISIHKKKSPK